MIKRLEQLILFCGIALTLAAFPAFAQENSQPEINKKPFQDFGAEISNRVQNKELDLSANFLVEVSGELTKEGKLDLQKTKFVRSEGDGKMLEVAKSAIKAVNDGGFFIYLSRLDFDKINLILEQNDNEISVIVTGDTISANKARSTENMLNAVVVLVKMKDREDEDTKTILDGTKISANDKSVIMKIAVKKSVGQEMIRRNLNKEIERKAKAKAGR